MCCKTNLLVVIALAVGAVGGWAGASGKFDSLLRAEQKASFAATEPTPCSEGVCCVNPDKAAALAAVSAHNAKVSANLQPGKKPNILIIWGDDIGWFNPSCYHGGIM